MEKKNDWISVKNRLPKKIGWYKVKAPSLRGIEYEIPYVRNAKGEMVWVAPEQTLITHWKEI